MRFYTVHFRRHAGACGTDADLVLVAEGFNWCAALFSVLWALWNRLWWLALAFIVFQIGLEAGLAAVDAGTGYRMVAAVALAVMIGLFANDGRRLELGGRGFEMLGVVGAPGRAAAEQRLFDLRPELAEEMRA